MQQKRPSVQKRRAWWITAVAVPLSAGAAPDLPEKSASEVLALVAGSDDAVYSGTLEQTSDLGLPEIPSTGGAGGDGASEALELLTASHEARIFVGGTDLQRVQVLDKLAERDAVRNGDDLWLYDSKAAEATHAVLPEHGSAAPQTTLTPAEVADQIIGGLDDSTEVIVEDDARVAGRDAYVLTLTPRTDETLVGSVTLSIDGETGLPLGASIFARGQEAAAFSVEFGDIDFSAPDASLFDFTPPAGADVTEVAVPSHGAPVAGDSTSLPEPGPAGSATVTGEGWSSIIAASVPDAAAASSADDQAADSGDSAEAAKMLDQLTTRVDGGRAVQTALVSSQQPVSDLAAVPGATAVAAPIASDFETTAIETRGLTKRFGAQVAVNELDLSVPRGSVFGFLGPNGSGKTTTIRMLLGLARASSGTIEVLGEPIPHANRSVLPRVGALVEGPAFYPFLSGRANLLRLDSADPLARASTRSARVDAALDRVGLAHAAGKKAHAYSLGMKQRLGIAGALLQPRELLVLDEPSNGLDPQGTREIRLLIRSLADDGVTVFVSSHLLAEIEQMCTHVAVMSAGRLVAQGPPARMASCSNGWDSPCCLTPTAAARIPHRTGPSPSSPNCPPPVWRPRASPPRSSQRTCACVLSRSRA
jgi:ABC-2 type transport system ATP-binding protein